MPKKTLVVILGATATGKTALSIDIARRLGTVVVSCDSRQFYREIPIGTAAPTVAEQAGVPHYFVGTRSVTEDYNSGRFEEDALALLARLFESRDTVIMTGGSGLYIDAVCYGLDTTPDANAELREQLRLRLEKDGLDALLSELRALDPEYYERVDKCNPIRVTRALEVCLGTGKKYSELRSGNSKIRDFEIIKIGITMPRDVLYERINRRVDMMIENGLVDEARSIYHLRQHNALQTVGYRELFDYFDGLTTLDRAVELIKRNSRRYAKRQITWFGKSKDISWFEKNDVESIEKYIKKFAE